MADRRKPNYGRKPARPREVAPLPPGVLRRNDTAYPTKVAAKLRGLHERYRGALLDGADPEHLWTSSLKYYQYLVRAVMTDPEYGIGADGNARGLLVTAQMGYGKTRIAVAVAMSMWSVRESVVMLPRSLRRNFATTVTEVVALLNPGAEPAVLGRLATEAEKKLVYVSADAYNAAEQLARAGLDGKLLIVDEAHNFFRAIINSSAEGANARKMYDMIMAARDLRLLFLTGTPASKDPFELVPCFNMLVGRDLLPAQYDVFYETYVDRGAGAVRNRGPLANRLVGLVSHVGPLLSSEPSLPEGAEPGPAPGPVPAPPRQRRDDGWFPEERPVVVSRVEMGPGQYRQYLLAREKEAAEGKGGDGAGGRQLTSPTSPPLALPGSEKKAMRSYFVKSRTLSLFSPAGERPGVLPRTRVESLPDSAFTAEASPKLALIAARADAAPGPVLAYSQFVDSGLKPLGRYLERLGYAPWVPPATAAAPRRREGAAPTAVTFMDAVVEAVPAAAPADTEDADILDDAEVAEAAEAASAAEAEPPPGLGAYVVDAPAVATGGAKKPRNAGRANFGPGRRAEKAREQDREAPADFPYRAGYIPPPAEMFSRLRGIALSPPPEWFEPSDDGPYFRLGLVRRTFPGDFDATDGLTDHFVEPVRIACRKRGEISPAAAWKQVRASARASQDTRARRELVYSVARGCNLFNGALAAHLLTRFGARDVLDCTAGWGDRLVAAFVAGVRYYRGWDTNPALQSVYASIGAALGPVAAAAGLSPPPDWAVELGPFERAAPRFESGGDLAARFDTVLFCPPYFDIEVYQGDGTSTEAHPVLDSWYSDFYRPAIAAAAGGLRPGGHFLAYVTAGKMREEAAAVLRGAGLVYLGAVGFLQVVVSADGTEAPGAVRDTFVWRRPGLSPVLGHPLAPAGSAVGGRPKPHRRGSAGWASRPSQFISPLPAQDAELALKLFKGPLKGSFTPEEAKFIVKTVKGHHPRVDPWYNPDEVPPFIYRSGKGEAVVDGLKAIKMHSLRNLHHGQRKLFISELQCLTLLLSRVDEECVVVYAGAAPGHHMPYLLELFPKCTWLLYDPAPFAVRPGPRVRLYNEYFTDEVATSLHGKVGIFICDIRLGVADGPDKQSVFEAQVGQDMVVQDRWTRLIAPKLGAMLKYRPPYLSPETPEGSDAAMMDYIRGRVLWQTWPSASSTEGRLIVRAEDARVGAEPMRFDASRYQNACAVHNVAIRPWATYDPPAPGLDAVPGYDRCFDCTNEAAAWVAYLEKPGAVPGGGAAARMNRLTIVSKQRLDLAGGIKLEMNKGRHRAFHGMAPFLPAARRNEIILAANGVRVANATGGDGGDGGHSRPAPRGHYAIISGEVAPEARDAIVAAFNSPENLHGAVIKAMLVSRTGAEGIDLKNVRETHCCEPYWDQARLDQLGGRAARMGSHDALPRAEREVQPYVYVAVANAAIHENMLERDREPLTIDEVFYERALSKHRLNLAFRQLLTEVSLECGIFGYGGCRVCVPTNAPLFTDDPVRDTRVPDPCELERVGRVEARPIVVLGTTYYFREDAGADTGYAIYEFREDLGAYSPLDPASPAMTAVLDAVAGAANN